jgi:RNA polymerase sigma-70 factor (ECF subfamily)
MARACERNFQFFFGLCKNGGVMSDELATQVLVSQAKAGSSQAVEELCRRYQHRILAAVRLRLGRGLRRKVESWDIVQDAMIDAFRRIEAFDFRTEGAFLKYVNKIVENRIRDAAQRWGAQRRDIDRELPLGGGDQSADSPVARIADPGLVTPSKMASLNEDLTQLERALDQLGDDGNEQRELIIAVKLEGRTYSELAAELGISEDAVRMRVNRAMESLTSLFRRLESR